MYMVQETCQKSTWLNQAVPIGLGIKVFSFILEPVKIGPNCVGVWPRKDVNVEECFEV